MSKQRPPKKMTLEEQQDFSDRTSDAINPGGRAVSMYIITIHGQPQTRLIAGCQAQGDELVARLVAAGRTPLTITVGDPPLRDRAEKARAAAIVEDVMS